MPHPTDRIIHTTAFVIPVVEHWLEREHEGSTRRPIGERSYHGATSRPPPPPTWESLTEAKTSR